MTESKRIPPAYAFAAALGLAVAAPALSGPSGPEAIPARQKAMAEVGEAMKPLAAIAKKQAAFDAAVVRKNAEAIDASLKAAEALFPPGSEKGSVESYAKAAVWADAAGFAAAMKASREAAAALAGVKEEAAYGPALKALGGSCKGCHEAYRLPKR